MLVYLSTYKEDFKYLFNEINIQHKTFILITLKGKSILNN